MTEASVTPADIPSIKDSDPKHKTIHTVDSKGLMNKIKLRTYKFFANKRKNYAFQMNYVYTTVLITYQDFLLHLKVLQEISILPSLCVDQFLTAIQMLSTQ